MQRRFATRLSCLIATTACLSGPAAYASFSYDFSTPPPATFVVSGQMYSGAPAATFSTSVSDGVLRLGDSTHPDAGGTFSAKALETSQVFTDVSATATLNPAGTSRNILNISLREARATGNTYAVGVDFRTGQLVVGKIYGRAPVQLVYSTDTGQGSQLPLTDLARSYFLRADAVGNNVTARLFDSPGGTQLRQVNYTDTGVGGSPFRSGISGLSVISGNTVHFALDGTFDNFTSTAVPEPGAAALSVSLGLALLRRPRSPLPG